MKKFLILALAVILFIPCLLTFTEGADGSVTVWNFVGLAWMACLIVGAKMLPKSVVKDLEKMMED